MPTPTATSATSMRSSKKWGLLGTRKPICLGFLRCCCRRLVLLFLQPRDLDLQELAQGIPLLRFHVGEGDRRAEDVLGALAGAAHLYERAKDFAWDVNTAVAGEDQRGRRPRADGGTMDDRGAAEAEVDQLAIDVGKLHGNRRRRETLRATSVSAGSHVAILRDCASRVVGSTSPSARCRLSVIGLLVGCLAY